MPASIYRSALRERQRSNLSLWETVRSQPLSSPVLIRAPAAPQSGNLTIQPDKPYTQDTPGFAYVYEQTDPEATLFAEAIVDGERTHLEAKLPEIIRRNCIYVVSVTKEESDAAVQLTVEARQEGDQIGMHPSLDGTITVDTDRSELPETATVTDSGTKLILPHNLTDFLLALDCDDELELLPPDNDDLTIEPAGLRTGDVCRESVSDPEAAVRPRDAHPNG